MTAWELVFSDKHCGLMAEVTGPVSIRDKELHCQICGNTTFHQREGKVSTTGLSFLGIEFLNRSAVCFVCSECGFIHWFLPQENEMGARLVRMLNPYPMRTEE